jgi:peptide/nickel transport system ATP-binding protein
MSSGIVEGSEPHVQPRLSANPSEVAEPVLDVGDLRVAYLTTRGAIRAVDGISLSIASGEIVGLAGESGSGKSTVAMALLRVLRPPGVITGGRVDFHRQDVLDMSDAELRRLRWRDVSMVFQGAMNTLNPVMTADEQIVDAILAHEKVTKTEARERAVGLLESVGIGAGRSKAYPHQLSGGMRQRVGIAMALALDPELIIMDEPTTSLDVVVQQEIMQQIVDLERRRRFSILFITHDLSLLVELCDRMAIMYAGQLVEVAPAQLLYDDPMHPYTRGLIDSFPTVSSARERLTGIAGNPPDMAALPAGCRFHPRCPHVHDRCRVEAPVIREVAPGRQVACHLHDAVPGRYEAVPSR